MKTVPKRGENSITESYTDVLTAPDMDDGSVWSTGMEEMRPDTLSTQTTTGWVMSRKGVPRGNERWRTRGRERGSIEDGLKVESHVRDERFLLKELRAGVV